MNITRLLSSKSAQIQLIEEQLQPGGKQNSEDPGVNDTLHIFLICRFGVMKEPRQR